MAKPKQKARVVSGSFPNERSFASGYEKYFLPAVLAITFLVLSPSLQNKFVNLDDPHYVLDNPVIKSLNAENLKSIFTGQFVGNYQPLTMLSYMIDFKLFGLNPFGYHLVNLLLHLLNTLLVFLIIKSITTSLTGEEKHSPPFRAGAFDWVPFLTALLFGIHPLHVESVAWISERKDVLYGFFFLWAMYLYVLPSPLHEGGINTRRFSPFRVGAMLLLFLLALLSKAQAVVLPIAFFVIDFLVNRKLTKRTVLEKVPFIILAVAFGLMAINVQGKAGAMQTFQYFPFHERILFSCYALMTYLHLILLPIDLSCFYPYPETNDKINTVWVYLSPAVLAALGFILWRFFRTSRVVLSGVFFFLITIVLVLQLLPIGDALYADRYTYIPSIGLFFIGAYYLSPFMKNKIAVAAAAAYFLFFFYQAFQRSKEWHDSIKLYTAAIDNGYKAAILYNNRGAVLNDSGRIEEALKDFTSLVALKPRYPNGWRNKGLVHQRLEQTEEAIRSFTEEIKIHPDDYTNYLSRGSLYVKKNDFGSAITDFSRIIELQPTSGEGYYARSEAYGKSGRLAEALADINKAIEFAPENGQAYNNRGIIYSMSARYPEAVNDFTRSLELKPDNVGAYTNRSLAYKGMGKYAEALLDLMTAKEKGHPVEESSINVLKALTGEVKK